jgi:hypothetical protein
MLSIFNALLCLYLPGIPTRVGYAPECYQVVAKRYGERAVIRDAFLTYSIAKLLLQLRFLPSKRDLQGLLFFIKN